MEEPMAVESAHTEQMQNGLPDNAEEPQLNGHAENGISNGPVENHVSKDVSAEKKSHSGTGDHKSSSSDKHKSSSSDKHRSSSHHSSSGDKHRSSSSSHKHKSGHSDKNKDGHKSSSSSHKHSSSSSDKDKHRSSSSHKHGSSSSGDKHRSSSSHSSSKDKDGKPHSSSSSSKHSSSHKSSSSSKHHSSSSSKDKHSSSSSSKHHSSSSDKHRSDKDKHRSSSDKHRSDKDKPRSDGEKPKTEADQQKIESEVKVEVKMEEDMTPVVKDEPVSPTKSPIKTKKEAESDDDVPLSARKDVLSIKKEGEKRSANLSDDDDQPLSDRMQKKKIKVEETQVKPVKKRKSMEEDDDFTPAKKKKKDDKKKKKPVKSEPPTNTGSPTKKGKVKKEDPDAAKKWKWWEEEGEEKEEGIKWKFLEHKGVVFAPEYERLPKDVRFYYDGEPMKLSEETEEVGGFYAKMLSHDYTTREVFNRNFFKDWRKVMTHEEKSILTDLSKCNFKEIYQYYTRKSEERKAMGKEEKKKIKEQNEAIMKEYGFCTIDGHTEKVGNFRIEPPGLFRGRGEHPKQGMLKKRVTSEFIIINCSKGSEVPAPPKGRKWKEVRHDPSVTWLASWTENVQNQTKYVMLAATSKLKGQKDMEKYEIARRLHQCVDKIRATYKDDWKSKEMRVRQRSVAMYFIDKLALRAGNEKDGDETADTVGCCSLRFEHIKLHEEKGGKEYVVEFDFLGKDSIRYHNEVGVEKRVFKNLQLFVENKKPGDDLFDRLNTTVMNKHLTTLMDGLTAKVFRTYNASRTLQEQLDLLTIGDDPVAAKTLTYNRANRAVAILCNHQRAVSKNFGKQMENMQGKIDIKKKAIHDAKRDLKAAKSDYKALKTENKRKIIEKKKKAVERHEDGLTKLEISMTDKDENKDIALGTSKLNYLDPRISVAWCKKWEVPIEKVYNKTQREKFAWAIEMAEADYKFTELDE